MTVAGMAFGLKIAESATEVRYGFGETPAADEGVLVIPIDDLDAWYVEGVDHRPLAAEWALVKVLRVHRKEGVWPDRAAFYG